MKKRLFFLIIGCWFLRMSINLFPSFAQVNVDVVLQKLIFEPFKLFGAIFFFIGGFLTLARVIKGICEEITKNNNVKQERLSIIALLIVFGYIGLESFLVAVAAAGLSLFYGVMDANIPRKSRYYNS
jgi:hypothetical protein